jgi:hypothetical protein
MSEPMMTGNSRHVDGGVSGSGVRAEEASDSARELCLLRLKHRVLVLSVLKTICSSTKSRPLDVDIEEELDSTEEALLYIGRETEEDNRS